MRHMTGVSILVRVILFSLLSLGFIGMLSSDVSYAHALLNDSVPEPGATVPSTPASVTLYFTEPLVADSVVMTVYLDGEPLESLPEPWVSEQQRHVLVQPFAEDYGPGEYRLEWIATSLFDGHRVPGSMTFYVGHPGTAVSTEASQQAAPTLRTDDIPLVAVSWTAYLSLLFFVGMNLLAWRLSARLASVESVKRTFGDTNFLTALQRYGRWAGLICLIVGTGALIARLSLSVSLSRLTLTSLMQNPFQLATATMALTTALMILPFFFLQTKANRPIRFAPLWSVIGMLLLIGFPISGHAGGAGAFPLSAVLFDWAHLLAASTWVGGLLYLVLVVFPASRKAAGESVRPGQLQRIAAEQFTLLAVISVLLLVATGVFLTEQRFESLREIPQSFYGQSLMVKIGIFLLMGFLAFIHSRILRPRLHKKAEGSTFVRSWRWSIVIEGVLGFLILGVVAALIAAPLPIREVTVDPLRIPELQEKPLTLSQNAGRLLLTMTAYPVQPGDNLFQIKVVDPYNPRLGPEYFDIQLELEPLAPSSDEQDRTVHRLHKIRQEDGTFLSQVTLNETGPWRLTVQASTPEVRGTAHFDFNVPGEDARIILDRAAEVIDSIEFFKIREDLFDGRNYYEHNYEMVGDQMVWYFQRPGGGEPNIRIGSRLNLGRYMRLGAHPRLLGIEEIDGTPTFKINFLDRGSSGWFTVWIESDTFRLRRFVMMYPAHYMTWHVYDFDVPNELPEL